MGNITNNSAKSSQSTESSQQTPLVSKFQYSKPGDSVGNLVFTMDELSCWEHRLKLDERFFHIGSSDQYNRSSSIGQSDAKHTGQMGLQSDVNRPIGQTGLQSDVNRPIGQTGLQSDVNRPIGQTGLQSDVNRPIGQTGLQSDVNRPIGQTGLQSDVNRPIGQTTGVQSDVNRPSEQAGLQVGLQDNLATKYVMVHSCLTTLFQRAIEIYKLGKTVDLIRGDDLTDAGLNQQQLDDQVERLRAMHLAKLGSWDHGKFAFEWLRNEYVLCLDLAKVREKYSTLSTRVSGEDTSKEYQSLQDQEEKLKVQIDKHRREACVVGLAFLDHQLQGGITAVDLPQSTTALFGRLNISTDKISPKDMQGAMDKLSKEMDSEYEQMRKIQQDKIKLERDYQSITDPSKKREIESQIQNKNNELNRIHSSYIQHTQEFNEAFSFFRDSFIDNVFGRLRVANADVEKTIIAIKKECIATQEASIKQDLAARQEISHKQEVAFQQQTLNKQQQQQQQLPAQQQTNYMQPASGGNVGMTQPAVEKVQVAPDYDRPQVAQTAVKPETSIK